MSSRCRTYAQPSQQYVPVFVPLTCPDTVNNDPKRFDQYCPPALCRSEPLSHSEYLRKLVQNNGVGISNGTLLTKGTGSYATTNWMESTGPCARNTPVPAAQTVKDASDLTRAKGAFASRGLRSKFDLEKSAELTSMRREGQAIAAESGCDSCTTPGFQEQTPNCC
jgi:hypothetical protein